MFPVPLRSLIGKMLVSLLTLVIPRGLFRLSLKLAPVLPRLHNFPFLHRNLKMLLNLK